jgi:SNF2 family DNA or RNA helicase
VAFAELDPGTTRIFVQTSFAEKNLIKTVPGITWDPTNKLWRCPLSWASCVALRGVFGPALNVGPLLLKWAQGERDRWIDESLILRTQTELLSDRYDGSGLYPFQQVGVEWLMAVEGGLLGDEMGTGKTVQVLAALDHLPVDDALPAIVICPNTVKPTWRIEAAKWLPKANVYVVTGTATERVKVIKAAAADPLALVVINYEAVRTFSRLAPFGSLRLRRCNTCARIPMIEGAVDPGEKQCEVHSRPLNEIPFRTVIIDEAHRMKDPTAKQTRASWALLHGPTVRRRWALTGTPLANNPVDVWSIMHGLAPDDFPSKTRFIDRYGLQSWNQWGGLQVVGLNPKTKDEFYAIFDPHFRRMPKDLVLTQLPPKVRERRFVSMSPRQARAYKELASGFITRLDDGTLLVSPNNLVAQTRLLQLSSSYCTTVRDGDNPADWTVTLTEPSPKIDALVEIIEDLGPDKSVVVCALHRQLIELASRRLTKLGIDHRLITGGVSTWERERALEELQSGRVKVLLFTIAAGGTGLTMTAADTIVFMQRSWSIIDNKQAEDRVHRIGSEVHESINVIDLVTLGTIEETVQIPRLYEKLERLEEITRDRVLLRARGLATTDLDNEEALILTTNIGVAA